MPVTPRDLLSILQTSWSLSTGPSWLPERPARGQCSVTALVVRELCGGEILKTPVEGGGWHFYNRVNGVRHDLTASQFDNPPRYADILSDEAEALAATTPDRYALLRRRVDAALADGKAQASVTTG